MERIEIPVIGIGAGPAADGQVLVFHDLLGIYDGHAPRFAKRYAEIKAQMVAGVAEYAAEVRSGRVPGPGAHLLDRRRGARALPRGARERSLRSARSIGGWPIARSGVAAQIRTVTAERSPAASIHADAAPRASVRAP